MLKDELRLGLNRGLYYGDGFFETIRAEFGEPLLFNFHTDRVKKACEFFKLSFPKNFQNKLYNQIIDLLKKNEQEEIAKVRVQFFRNGFGTYTPQSDEFSYIIESKKLEINRNKVLSAIIFHEQRLENSPIRNFKTSNALPYVFAADFASQNNKDLALLLNQNDEICEFQHSNIFFQLGNKIITPSLNSPCVDGVMRRKLILDFKKKGFELIERKINISELNTFEKCFASNSLIGLVKIIY